MKGSKVVIIGGGIAGLTAGIYLQTNGYETVVVEKNGMAGGACVGWERKGCYIDGCIHWLTGVNPRSNYYDLWQDIGVVSEDTEIFYQNDFACFDFGDGKKLTLWADIEQLKAELLAFAPEDKRRIERLIRMIKRFQRIEGPVFKPADMMNLWELLKVGLTMGGDYFWVSKTSKTSCVEFASRFKNPYLKKAFSHYMSPGYNLMSMLFMLGHVSWRNGGIPVGGSMLFSEKVEERYTGLGGKIMLNSEVEKVIINGSHAQGVLLKNGEQIHGDWVISTTPAEHCLNTLLGKKYPLKKIDLRLADQKTYPIYTYSIVAFKCRADITAMPLSTHIYPKEKISLDREYGAIVFRNYSYDATLKREDGTYVMQAAIHGDDQMYFWWKGLKDTGKYKEQKRAFGQRMLEVAEECFPELKGKLEVIDVVTPCTYERYLNTRHGSFQGFVHTSKGKALMERGIIKGLDNFLLSGQCIFHSGGLPTAAITGRFAAQRVCRADGKAFVYRKK